MMFISNDCSTGAGQSAAAAGRAAQTAVGAQSKFVRVRKGSERSETPFLPAPTAARKNSRSRRQAAAQDRVVLLGGGP